MIYPTLTWHGIQVNSNLVTNSTHAHLDLNSRRSLHSKDQQPKAHYRFSHGMWFLKIKLSWHKWLPNFSFYDQKNTLFTFFYYKFDFLCYDTDADVSKDRRSTDLFLKGLYLSNFENLDLKRLTQRTNDNLQKRNSNAKLPDMRNYNKLLADFSKLATLDETKNIYDDHKFDGVKIISRFSISSLNDTAKDAKTLDTTKTVFYVAQAEPLRTIDITYKQRDNRNRVATAAPSPPPPPTTTVVTTRTPTTTTTTPATTITTPTTISTTKKPFLIQIF